MYDIIMQNNPETEDRKDLYKEQDKKRDAAMESSLAILARAARKCCVDPLPHPTFIEFYLLFVISDFRYFLANIFFCDLSYRTSSHKPCLRPTAPNSYHGVMPS